MYGKSSIMKILKPIIILTRVCGSSIIPLKIDYERQRIELKKAFWSWGFIVMAISYTIRRSFTSQFHNNMFLIHEFLIIISCMVSESDFYLVFLQIFEVDEALLNDSYSERYSVGYLWLVAYLLYYLIFILFMAAWCWLNFSGVEFFELIILSASKMITLSYLSLITALTDELANRFQLLSNLWSETLLDSSSCTVQKIEQIRILHGKLCNSAGALNSAINFRLAVFFLFILAYLFYFMNLLYFDGFSVIVIGQICSFTFSAMPFAYTIMSAIKKLSELNDSIIRNISIIPISRLPVKCQIQVRMIYHKIRNNPLAIMVCGHVIDSHIWPSIILEETTYWLAAIQLQHEFERLSTNIRLQWIKT